MKIAITGATGLVGSHVARVLAAAGHELVLMSRGRQRVGSELRQLKQTTFFALGLDDPSAMARAFAGCGTVVHCAGINRELGEQTYQRVHIEGTRNVVEAARRAGVSKVVLVSFLRARPHCCSAYHESKWAAEEIVRGSGLDYTVLKCGVIYGQGDHMLDHLSRGFYTFPVFAFVGFRDKPIRPNAVEDVARIIKSAAVEGALSNRTVPVIGPEELMLSGAVRRVARVVGRRPLMFPLPLWFHYALGWLIERVMTVPMVSIAQVRILSEGLSDAAPPCDPMPADLAPRIPFSEEQVRKGLPPPGRFGWRDLRCCSRGDGLGEPHRKTVFFEMP
jgi:NADH dehydrogenase